MIKIRVKKIIIVAVFILMLAVFGFALFSYLVIPRGHSHFTEQERMTMYDSLTVEEKQAIQQRLNNREVTP
jgi:hypothetical protein